MRRRIQRQLLAIAFMLLCLLPLKTWAASTSTIRNLYAFGDSLSDPGNVFSASVLAAGAGLPPPPYFEGRFANGYLWIDYLAEQLGLQLQPIAQLPEQPTAISFAYGGATSGIGNVINTALPGLLQEVEQFKQFVTPASINPQTLYTLWIGANDYLSEGASEGKTALQVNSTQAIENIVAAIRSLHALGARNFMVANLPALGKTPLAQALGQETALELNQITKQHNLALEQQLQSLEQTLPDLHLIRLNVEQLFEQSIQGQRAFANVSSPCFDRTTGRVCPNPDQYLFWDQLHPTTAAHQIVANLAAETLKSELQSSSQSSRMPSLLILGTLSLIVGANAIHRNRRSL